MTVQLTHRLFRDSDLPGLLRLWEKNTEWGTLTPELWRRSYIDTPHGPSLVAVALDENEDIAGQLIFTPSRVVVGDREVRALRLSAQILREDLSRASLRSLDHPVFGLYKAGEEVAVEAGYGLWYALPRYGWLPIVPLLSRFAGREITSAEYGCVGTAVVPVPPVSTDEASSLTARPAANFGPEYEALWQSARHSFPITCSVVRSPDWHRYNNASGLTLEVRSKHDGTLVGYSVVKRQPPLLCDLLARNPVSLAPVLRATLDWLAAHQGGAATNGMDHLNAMETPALRPTLRALGFTPVNYKFAFVCATLDPSIPTEAIAPERWYITAGDHGP